MDTRSERLFGMYEKMLLIRRFEEATAKAYASGKIRGFCHLYIGEEPVAVGAIENLEPQDYVICTYREHGHALARGMAPRAVMAELFGKATGCSKGLGGSMHLFSRELNFMGGHGIVGGHVAVASGHAFASKYRGDHGVTLCFVGEGGTNIGGFFEGLTYDESRTRYPADYHSFEMRDPEFVIPFGGESLQQLSERVSESFARSPGGRFAAGDEDRWTHAD